MSEHCREQSTASSGPSSQPIGGSEVPATEAKAWTRSFRHLLDALQVVPLSPTSDDSHVSVCSSEKDNHCLSPRNRSITVEACRNSTTEGSTQSPPNHIGSGVYARLSEGVPLLGTCTLQAQPQAKAMPKANCPESAPSPQQLRCHYCATCESCLTCNNCSLPTCNNCRFRRWQTCKTCFWAKDAAKFFSLNSPGLSAQALEKRIADQMEAEDMFWKAFLTVEGQPNAMSLAASISKGRHEASKVLCAVCRDVQQSSKAIADCARCGKPLCEDCVGDYPSCQCLACHVYTIHAMATGSQ